jgi:DNA polymerase-3 subunit beta
MKFTTPKFVLKSTLERAFSVVPSSDSVPVLKNFMVQVKDGELHVSATDQMLAVIAATTMIAGAEDGSAVLPAAQLVEAVRLATGDSVSVAVTKNKATVTSGKTSWVFTLPSADNYPTLPNPGDLVLHTLSRENFLHGLTSVRYAASKDTARANLMLLAIDGPRFRTADGLRFQQTVLGEDEYPPEFQLQLPIGAVDELIKMLKASHEETIKVGQDDTSLVFTLGELGKGDLFVAQKSTSKFPDVETALLNPALANDQTLELDRKELVGAISRVRIASDEGNAVVLQLKENECTVSAKDKYGSLAEEALDAVWEHEPRKIVANHHHLLEMLKSSTEQSVKLVLGTDTKAKPSPILFRGGPQSISVLNQLRHDYVK